MHSDENKRIRERYMIQFKGKDYLPVAPRVLMFRNDHPDDMYISTEIVDISGNPHVKASIFAKEGDTPLATAHKRIKINDQGRGAFSEWPVETAETGAIGRALALMGYGTVEAGDDLEEGDQIADSPVETGAFKPKTQRAPVQEPQAKGWNI